jgi:hypothetical protein
MTEIKVLQKVALEALWLLETNPRINKDSQSLKVYYDEVLFDDEFEIEDHRIESAWPGIANVDNDSRGSNLIPGLIGLLLLPNLISLKIDDRGKPRNPGLDIPSERRAIFSTTTEDIFQRCPLKVS